MTGVITDLGSASKQKGFYLGQMVSGSRLLFCNKCHNCKSHNQANCSNIIESQGTFADYVVWKERQCIPLPEDYPIPKASLISPAAISVMAYKKLNIMQNDSICILGCTFESLIFLQLLKLHGIKNISILCRNERETERAKNNGADNIFLINDELSMTNLFCLTSFEGFNKILVAKNTDEYIETAVNTASRGASILLTDSSYNNSSLSIRLFKISMMHLNIMTSFLYDMDTLMETREIIKDIDAESLIEKEYSFCDIQKALDDENLFNYPRIGISMGDL